MNCTNCTAEVTNGLALCQRCQQTLTVALVNAAAFFSDVDRITPGQRVKVRSAYTSTPPPDTRPARDPISNALDYVATIVFSWCRNLEDDRPDLAPMPRTTALRCGWLENRLPSIVTLPWANELLREMRECERMLQRILDRSDTGWYAGKCNNEIGREADENGDAVVPVLCDRGLYVSPSTSWVRCPECGRQWDADQRREYMMTEAKAEVAPVRVIARIAVGLTDEVSEERLTRRIEKWVERGQLRDLGVRVLDGHPRRVYRLGDVLALVSGEVKPKEVDMC